MNSKDKLKAKKQEKQKAKDQKLQKLTDQQINQQKQQKQDSDDDGIDLQNKLQDESDLDPVDFLLVEPDKAHYHSLKNLLNQYRISTNNKVPVLSDYISQNKQFGVAIVQDVEDNDSDAGFDTVFSILTFIPTDIEDGFAKDMKKYFVTNCQKHCKNKQKILQLISNKKCSFIINDRYINLMPKLIPLQHQTLKSDFEQLKKSKSKNKVLNTQYLLGMTRTATPAKKGQKNPTTLQSMLLYHFQQSEILKHAQAYWVFPDDSKVFGKQSAFNLHYIISLEKYLNTVPKLQSLIKQ